MKTNQKGFIQIILIVLLALAIAGVGVFYFLQQKYDSALNPPSGSVASQYQQQYQQAVQGVSRINDNSGLNAAASSLDSTDPSQLNIQVNQVNSDASSF